MEILFNEPQPIAVHTIAAMAAILLGGVQLYMKKGGVVHKMLGRVWLGLMLLVAFTRFKVWVAFRCLKLKTAPELHAARRLRSVQ